MDCWPVDDREITAQNSQTKRKGKDKRKSSPFAYPLVEHGTLNSATLYRDKKRLEWTFISGDASGRRLLPRGDPVVVFPDTRPHAFRDANVSVLQRAEQSAHYLRTYHPDMEFSSELIRNEIVEDVRVSKALHRFDPAAGTMINAFTCLNGSRDQSAFLAFPMGETYCDLNISPLIYSRTEHISLKAHAKPAWSFQTPIRQIAASKPSVESKRNIETILGVRTFGSTSLLEITPNTSSFGSRFAQVQPKELMNILRSDIGDKRVMDMSILSSKYALAFVVTDSGAVYRCNTPQGDKLVQLVYSRLSPSQDAFWRLGKCDDDDESCLLINGSRAQRLDFRSQDSAVDLYLIQRAGELLTSVGDLCDNHLICLTTTEQILWIDERKPDKPLMGVKHCRDYDRALSTQTHCLTQTPISFLTSHRTGLVTVYDVSHSENDLIRLHVPPYALPAARIPDGCHLGHVFFQHPSNPNDRDISLLQLSERGGVHMLDLQLCPSDVAADVSRNTRTTILSPDVQRLEQHVRSLRFDMGVRGERSVSQVDLQPAYNKLFLMDHGNALLDNPEHVYNLLENMPSFWQELDAPIESALTTFDIALRSGLEPDETLRNDFFAESPIHSVRGFRALMQGRIPVKKLIEGAPYHLNINPFLRNFIPELKEDLEETISNLRRYDLVEDEFRLGPSFRVESEAREQLLLDLSLASDIFSPQRFENAVDPNLDDAMDTMSRAAEAMSLEEAEPSPVHFGFIHPVPKGSVHHYPDATAEATGDAPEGSFLPPGIRLLLHEWVVGTDPRAFSYQDPYGAATGARDAISPRMPSQRDAAEPAGEDVATQSQRPPLIAPSTQAPPAIASSQPVGPRRPLGATRRASSQDFMASTQVLPGPHGGRPPVAKKKPVKKRVAGSVPGSCRVLFQVRHPPAPAQRSVHSYTVAQPHSTRPRYGLVRTHETGLPAGYLFDWFALNESLRRNKAVVCALSASYISTFAGYPLDSIKSRLQTIKTPISLPTLALLIYREEGIIGFYRGLWIPLVTISFVRAASFTIYTRSKEYCRDHHLLTRNNLLHVASTGGIGGALAGSLISFGSAPFELVKVRRQLEYSIAASKGVHIIKAPSTADAVRDICRSYGLLGLYNGFFLHLLRDTIGTGLYFFEYDGLRYLMGRMPSGEQGPTPPWMPIHSSLVPFMCGSIAGVTSWAIIYPFDVVKTKVQQRALAGERKRGVFETLHRLLKGPDPSTPRPLLQGLTRLYRGLGVSALRSVTTHGLLWTFFDLTADYIDRLPHAPEHDNEL
ncbi:hypothetical protein B0H21DRAFT_829833 [Amylocystis lapponica]|nr:hypothetical protein B0H21DRAFT_829833 [Amylocystis lapponica]